MLFGILCEASRTCLWPCLRGAHVMPVGPGLFAFSCRSIFDVETILVIPSLQGVLVALRQATKLNHTYRISVCSVKKTQLASSLSLVAGVHITTVRRNPPITDDHNLSNLSERYRTRLEDDDLGPSMTPFKHVRRFTDTMQCSKRKTCTKLLRLDAKKETSHWLQVCRSEHSRDRLFCVSQVQARVLS